MKKCEFIHTSLLIATVNLTKLHTFEFLMCRMILLPLHPSILCSLIVHWLEPKKFRTNLPLLFYFFFLLVRVTLCLWLVGKMLTSQNQLKVFTWVIWAIWHYLGTIHSFLMPHQNGRHHLAQGPLRCKFQSCNVQNFGVLESGHPKGRGWVFHLEVHRGNKKTSQGCKI